jgi:PAS domain-containing protein
MTEIQSRASENIEQTTSGSAREPSAGAPFFSDPELICVALEAGQIGIWSWDIASKRAAWSTNIEGICGLAKGSFDGTTALLENDIHPEDRPGVMAAMQEALRTGTPRHVQYRLLPRPGAEERWIETVATVVV